ncbi:hypothetical protein KOW79_020647 [Hemibagrus wyckioides]|uniref:Uncharacterized protein n=1 Tax=Hemibagrus wyckioides TaxID=337641 RepID=A0A9D3N4C2_9TELE|nr:hypothetical protein KOW79_020647 [Hemibagrus wyckioides]
MRSFSLGEEAKDRQDSVFSPSASTIHKKPNIQALEPPNHSHSGFWINNKHHPISLTQTQLLSSIFIPVFYRHNS